MNVWFYLGYFMFTLTLGFLMGSSNSPVIGSFLSGLIGVLIALISVQYENEGSIFSFTKRSLSNFGKALFGFSLFLLLGLFLGENYRNGKIFKPHKEFVWEQKTPPYNLYEALDWIVLNEKLSTLGYSKEQIDNLYKIRLDDRIRLEARNELEEYGYMVTDIYDRSNPFHKILSVDNIQSITSTRGPASED